MTARDDSNAMSRRTVLKVDAAAAGAAALTATPVSVASAAPNAHHGRRARLRDLGIVMGELPTGRHETITDVPGVVGYKTLTHGRRIYTGVTIINPRADQPIWNNFCNAGFHNLNVNGEMTGLHWVNESGWLTSMIGITKTHQVGIVRDTLIKWESKQNLSWRLRSSPRHATASSTTSTHSPSPNATSERPSTTLRADASPKATSEAAPA